MNVWQGWEEGKAWAAPRFGPEVKKVPYKTVRRKGKLVNINAETGEVHGTFPATAEGHRRAGGQISILERAEGIRPKKKRKRWVPPTK